jgi:hypothetical protein
MTKKKLNLKKQTIRKLNSNIKVQAGRMAVAPPMQKHCNTTLPGGC